MGDQKLSIDGLAAGSSQSEGPWLDIILGLGGFDLLFFTLFLLDFVVIVLARILGATPTIIASLSNHISHTQSRSVNNREQQLQPFLQNDNCRGATVW